VPFLLHQLFSFSFLFAYYSFCLFFFLSFPFIPRRLFFLLRLFITLIPLFIFVCFLSPCFSLPLSPVSSLWYGVAYHLHMRRMQHGVQWRALADPVWGFRSRKSQGGQSVWD
jgi:hypothetical protein